MVFLMVITFVKKTMIMEQGEIVIAMIENEASKRYYLEQDALIPASQRFYESYICSPRGVSANNDSG